MAKVKKVTKPAKSTKSEPSTKKKVTFSMSADTGSQVYIAGTFNNWNPEADPLKPSKKGVFTTTLELLQGIHEYKFVVNGQWLIDHKNEEWVPNDLGSLNSVLYV